MENGTTPPIENQDDEPIIVKIDTPTINEKFPNEPDEEIEEEEETDEDNEQDDDDDEEEFDINAYEKYVSDTTRQIRDEKAKESNNFTRQIEEEQEEEQEEEDDWTKDDDYADNAVRITKLIDSLSTAGLRKFIETWIGQGTAIKEFKKTVEQWEIYKRHNSYNLEMDEYIEAVKAYIQLYEKDIPMPPSLKRSINTYIKMELKKYLSKHANSPLVGLIVTLTTFLGNVSVKAITLKKTMVPPEFDGKVEEVVDTEYEEENA